MMRSAVQDAGSIQPPISAAMIRSFTSLPPRHRGPRTVDTTPLDATLVFARMMCVSDKVRREERRVVPL
jgi:hypothetical protein